MAILPNPQITVEEDLDHEILPETHPPMYLMHKYFARKPANIIDYYILKYSQKDEIVLDPFMGSGTTVIEALLNGRKAVGCDINPISLFITENTLKSIPISDMDASFQALKKRVFETDTIYRQLYSISCPICRNQAVLTHIIWHNENSPPSIVEIRVNCPNCQEITISETNHAEYFELMKNEIRIVEDSALDLLHKLGLKIPDVLFEYPDHQKFIQLRHNLRKNNTLKSLFTQRNLVFLTYLHNLFHTMFIENEALRSAFLFIFTSALGQASKMVWVIDKRKGEKLGRKQVGSWTHHFFWDPTDYFEVNAWACFRERFDKYIHGKKDLEKKLNTISPISCVSASQFADLKSQLNFWLSNSSAENLRIPDNSVDFIFTDPPYGDSIQYGELCAFWSPWLNLDMSQYLKNIHEHEITINTHQKKSLIDYKGKLLNAFKEMIRVLKPLKYLLVTFHNTDFEIRNSIIEAGLNAGFNLKQLIHQMPPRVSIKSMLHHKGSPVGDYYIRFQKPDPKIQTQERPMKPLTQDEIIFQIQQIITNILCKRGEPTSFLSISNYLDEFLFQAKLYPLPQFEKCLKIIKESRIFIIDAQQNWWFRAADISKFAVSIETPLSIRIENSIKQILSDLRLNKPINEKITNNNKKTTLKQYVFNTLYAQFRGVYTPDKWTVSKIIEKELLKK